MTDLRPAVPILRMYDVAATLRDNPTGLLWASGFLAAFVVAGAVRLARHPSVAARIGVHDWPVDSDCIDGPVRG